MKHLRLFEDYRDIYNEGYPKAWEEFKKKYSEWTKEDVLELALTFYKDPDDAEEEAAKILAAEMQTDEALEEGKAWDDIVKQWDHFVFGNAYKKPPKEKKQPKITVDTILGSKDHEVGDKVRVTKERQFRFTDSDADDAKTLGIGLVKPHHVITILKLIERHTYGGTAPGYLLKVNVYKGVTTRFIIVDAMGKLI